MSRPTAQPPFPRGIAPDLLASQIRNTMPYLFADGVESAALGRLEPAITARDYDREPPSELSHFDYFKLCLSAHYLTCATPVPTDVDNQIRQKLWPRDLPLEIAVEMTDLVLSSRKWDFTLVSGRFAFGPAGSDWESQAVDGHLGEWFTFSCAAYCALRQYDSTTAATKRQEVFAAIEDEVDRHSEIFGALWRANDGVGCLKASSSLAHNFGDLDRVMDMWNLPIGDPLRLRFYKLGISPLDPERKLRYLGRLWVAGELYKSTIDGSSMALENHRHYALRKPKPLRSAPALIIPTAPFFDDWGRDVGRELRAPDGSATPELLEVVDALTQGWDRQPKTMAYGRGLLGILEIHPKLDMTEMLKAPGHKEIMKTTQARFEKKWNDEALKWMDEIPSRA